MLILTLFTSLISILLYSHADSRCGVHKMKEHEPIEMDVYNGTYSKRLLQSQQWEPIRIYIDYSNLDSQNIDTNLVSNLKQTMEQSIQMFHALLKVRQLTSKLVVNGLCNGKVLSQEVRETGVEADVIMAVMYESDSTSNTTEAYSTTCRSDVLTKRPLVGTMTFTSLTNFTKPQALEYYIQLTLHEMTHILVFYTVNYARFINPDNMEVLGLDKVIQTSFINGMQRNLIVTPKVVQAARKHYNCSTLQGVELENQGGEGTSGVHWESRLMLGDLMISENYEEITLSEMTLALFEDSGWYKVNYYTGGLFRYGKNEGCDFLNKKCVKNNETDFKNEFCITSLSGMCTSGRLAKGYCSVRKLQSSISNDYNYFSSPTIGGYTLADYCPIVRSDDNNDFYYSNSCVSGLNFYPASLGETICPTCSCFISSLIPNSDSSVSKYIGTSFPICYMVKCNYVSFYYTIEVNGKIVKCPKEGGFVTYEGYSGQLHCPHFYSICTNKELCKNLIDCVTKQSIAVDPSYDYEPNKNLLYEGTRKWFVDIKNQPFDNTANTNDEIVETVYSLNIKVSFIGLIMFSIMLLVY